MDERFLPGTVTSRRDLAPDLWVITIRPEAGLGFRPGQYATVGVEVDGKLLERPYSIVSSPEEPELELFIELVPDGLLTPHLHLLHPGAAVVLRRKTKGVFLKGAPVEAEDHLFVATVTGVAPFASLLRMLARRCRDGEWTTDRRLILLLGASRGFELGYTAEMEALAAEMPWFEFVPTVSRPWEDPGWAGETGRVEDVVRKHSDRLGLTPGSAGVYLCGHPEMIRGVRGIMRRRGFDDAAIREEQYWPEGK